MIHIRRKPSASAVELEKILAKRSTAGSIQALSNSLEVTKENVFTRVERSGFGFLQSLYVI